MSDGFARFLRSLAALLASLYGCMLVATLWLRELTEVAALDALIGGIYVILGIGLVGRSRFSLFLGVILPAISIAVIGNLFEPIEQVYRLRITVDATIALFSLIALWHVRNVPSA